MRKFGWLLITLLLSNFALGQQSISGTLLSHSNREPVSFAKIKILGTNRGAISNEDGVFELEEVSESDSLLISHFSVVETTVAASYFLRSSELVLLDRVQAIPAVEVIGAKGEILNLFDIARDKLSKAEQYESKTYFTMESSADNLPIELIEAYYQSTTKGGRIQGLSLKNGRIGMSTINNSYFVSLSTTQVLKDYNLHDKKHSEFPWNPLMLPKRKIKRLYNTKVTGVSDGILTIRFVPKKELNRNALFPATVYLDKPNQCIVRIEFTDNDLRTHPLRVINKSDTISRLDYDVAYNFSCTDQRLESIELQYKMDYLGPFGLKHIHSEAAMLFFDTTLSYTLPLYGDEVNLYSDYDKIVSQPNNDFFWVNNEVLTLSRKKKAYKRYFERNGVLLNFNELSAINPKVFANRLKLWSPDERIQLYDLNEVNTDGIAEIIEDGEPKKMVLTELYELRALIYLDRNQTADSTHFEVKTLINLQDSYYFLKRTPFTVCFINLYFDLVEVQRRKLEQKLKGQQPDLSQMKELYESSQSELNRILKTYIKEVERGTNQQAMEHYINLVKRELGVDNSFLIEQSDLLSRLDSTLQIPDPIIQRYNYGRALLSIDKYKLALEVFLEAEAMGDRHPWLFYNIGLCYYHLGEKEIACEYFLKSEAAGEELEAKLKIDCE